MKTKTIFMCEPLKKQLCFAKKIYSQIELSQNHNNALYFRQLFLTQINIALFRWGNLLILHLQYTVLLR